MKETPLPFKPQMVVATLADLKTNTRRVIVPQPHRAWTQATIEGDTAVFSAPNAKGFEVRTCPYGGIGDRLWVRESSAIGWCDDSPLAVDYHADGKRRHFLPTTPQEKQASAAYIGDSRRPPFLMPRWASRILLEITQVRVERVQEITEADAIAEGCVATAADTSYPFAMPARMHFVDLWDAINAKRGYGWAVDPWVWVISYKRVV